jgi:hypothetical protein
MSRTPISTRILKGLVTNMPAKEQLRLSPVFEELEARGRVVNAVLILVTTGWSLHPSNTVEREVLEAMRVGGFLNHTPAEHGDVDAARH